MNTTAKWPPILYGAAALAVLSLIWSGYAISGLMDSGRFGLSVAVAGDIGWITVLWAEYKGVTIGGYRWPAIAAGWLIAAGVAVLLVIHGAEYSRAQAIAGPFVVLVSKVVWAFALEATKDPTALTPEQQAEIHAVIRDSSYEAQLHSARLAQLDRATDAEAARIRAEARTTMVRDEVDFDIQVERVRKQAELARRTPLALPPAPRDCVPGFDTVADQAVQVTREEPQAQPAEPEAQHADPAPVPVPVTLISSQVTPAEPAEPKQLPFGFAVRQNTQSVQRAAALKRVAELVAEDPGITSAQVAEHLAVSPATAKRYLREARQGGTR